jgi:hypothetical protein
MQFFANLMSSSNHPAETLWNMIPWSFMADWFLNLGSYIKAKENRFKFLFQELELMQQQTTVYRVYDAYTPTIGNSNVYWKGGVKTNTAKLRTQTAYPEPMVSWVPYISEHKFILGSMLAAIKLR